MAKAANLSGQAINITKTTAPHALSYRISSKYDIQHGHAVALTLGKFFLLNTPNDRSIVIDKRGNKYLEQTMRSLFKILNVKSAEHASQFWYKLMKKCGLEPDIIKACSLSKNDLTGIIRSVDQVRLKNNPVKVSSKDIFRVIWKE